MIQFDSSCHEADRYSLIKNNQIKMFFKLILITLVLSETSLTGLAADGNLNTYDELDKTVAELVELRGYKAKNHYVTTTDGYILNLVELINPEIDGANKIPVLFIHGTVTNGKCFLINSVGAKPRDYSNLNASSMSLEELENMLGDDPTANSMPLLLSNFGHSVWIINRRGGYESQGHVGENTQPFTNPIINGEQALVGGVAPTSRSNNQPVPQQRKKRDVNPAIYDPISGFISSVFSGPNIDLSSLKNTVNPRYWNFSLDQQALYDVPEVIYYVLNQTMKEKLSIVSHSAGGTLTLMSLINYPDLADKLSTSLLWAPALYQDSSRLKALGFLLNSILMPYLGPIPPAVLLPFIQRLIAPFCSNPLSVATICRGGDDLIFGFGGQQQEIYPGFFTAFLDAFSAHDYVTILQAAIQGQQHHYDYFDSTRNQIAYSQPTAPAYDITRVKSRTLSLWAGGTDGIVPETGVKRTAELLKLRVPVMENYIDQAGIYFNHISFFLHQNVSSLLNIPGLRQIHSYIR